ncbi:MAG: head GIN domain-containing protein [Ferruginibacter sp.]
MKRILIFACLLLMASVNIYAQTSAVAPFEKVIISPYIQVTLVEGDKEDVAIESCTVDKSKLHIEVNNKTLWIYLDGAKQIPKNETTYKNGYKEKHSIYQGTVVIAIVTYKTLNDLSVRGEETQLCKSALSSGTFKLKIYGESKVIFNEVNFGELRTKLYGESTLEIKAGAIKEQRYTSYGESKINTSAVNGRTGYITAYGEADFIMNASDKIKITAFGEAKLHYKGDPEIVKGIHIGDMQIDKMD